MARRKIKYTYFRKNQPRSLLPVKGAKWHIRKIDSNKSLCGKVEYHMGDGNRHTKPTKGICALCKKRKRYKWR